MELISLKKLPKESKEALIQELGYDSDGEFVLELNGEKRVDPYTETNVRIDNMLILPGSTIILDNNPISIASYFEEYGELI